MRPAQLRPEARARGANLGLYSVTFVNDIDRDLDTLHRYKEFREEAERKGFRHFLEVFDPNVAGAVTPEILPGYINDLIARTLAGVAEAGRPVFLKIVYHGPQAMEELVRYDPHLVVGILGGAAGTTYDAFKLLGEAKKYGTGPLYTAARSTTPRINWPSSSSCASSPTACWSRKRRSCAYHGVLEKLGVKPHRSLADDMVLQTAVMSYGGTGAVSVPAAITKDEPKSASSTAAPAKPASSKSPAEPAAKPDFAKMTPAERLAYHQARLKRILG